MGKQEQQPKESSPAQLTEEPPKKRRWLRLLVILLVAICLLVFVSPYVISSGPVLGWILSSVNDGIAGKVAVDELSLGWFSPVSARGVVVFDAQGRQVLSVPEVRASRSLLGLATGPTAFGQIEVDEPNVVCYEQPGGGYSLSEAFESTAPSDPDEQLGALPGLRGAIVVRKATVTFVDPNGQRLVFGADSQVDMRTLDHLAGTSTTRLPNGGVLRTRYDLSGLVRDGRFQPDGISGSVQVWTEAKHSIDLEPLGEFALPGKGLAGAVAVDANFTLDEGRPRGDLRISVRDLQAAEGYAAKAQPVSFDLTGEADYDGKEFAGVVVLADDPNRSGGLGHFDGKFAYRPGPTAGLTVKKLLGALLAGEKLTLPEMSLDANAGIDLVALTRAVPSLVELRQDVTVTGGTFRLDSLTVRGGGEPTLTLDAGFEGVTGERTKPDGRRESFELKPISMKLDSALKAGSGLTVGQLVLKSAFAQLDGSGTPKDFRADYRVDLAVAQAEIGKVLELDKRALAGVVTGHVQARRPDGDKAILVTGLLSGTDLAVDGNSLLPDGRQLRLHLTALSVDPSPGRFELKGVSIDFGQALLASASGQYAADSGVFSVDAKIDRGALGDLLHMAEAFGVKLEKPVSGSLTGAVKIGRQSPAAPIVADGTLTLSKLRIDGKAVGLEEATFKPNVRIDPNMETIHLVSASIQSDALALTASGTVSNLSGDKVLDILGHYKGRWDRIMAIAHELAPATSDVALAGPLESEFALTGPASRPKLALVHSDMRARASVGWLSARLMGFELGQTAMLIPLEAGRVVIPATEIPAPGGKVNLAATIDLTKPTPQLLMPGKITVLKNLEINPEVGRKVLSRLNPIFGQLLSLQGRVTLVTEDINVPLGEAIKNRGTGRGHVDLSDLQFEPDGMAATLLELGGLGGRQLVQVGSADFEVKDGALRYDKFSMTFGETFDLHFRGAVRFDDSVDMVVSVPVRAGLLKKLGVGASAVKYAELLEGARIDLPIVGTRMKPGLDFSKVNIQPLLEKAAKRMLDKEVGGLLDGLIKPGKRAKPEPPDQSDRPGPTTQESTTKPEDALIKGIFDALDKWGESKDKK